MTESVNTSISAIGVLFWPGPDVTLHVYRNNYAPSAVLARHATPQFELEAEVPGNTAKW